MKLSRKLSEKVFEIKTEKELQAWIREVDREVGGLKWCPLGGIENNVHTVEVASDPALALVERPTNSIDAMLDLKKRELAEEAKSPHEAARKWYGIPSEGLSGMSERERRDLADHVRVTMQEAGIDGRPTIVIQDAGTGQHPDEFLETLLSLLKSNKKTARHQMGVYNAGGAASYKWANGTIIASRLAPSLLNGRPDEIGVTVVRYNALDPERYKSGVYEYMAHKDKSILRLDLEELPELPHGTYVKLVEYLLPKYARAAHEPKRSLWHLFHAALPEPALPIRIVEERVDRFPAIKGTPERRVISGLRHLLERPGTSVYQEERIINLGEHGSVTLRYYVLDGDPDAYTTAAQGLTISLNGQRQITRERDWVRRKTELYYIWRQVVILVDGTTLSPAAMREVFAATRETGADTPLATMILERVTQELREDEELFNLDELARQRTLRDATKSTSEKLKKQLASQIGSFLEGKMRGRKGGKTKPRQTPRRRKPRPVPPKVDDSTMLEIPDRLVIVSDPLRIENGGRASLILEINAKNGFLPRHSDGLTIIFGPELQGKVSVGSKGRLVGGRVRIALQAEPDVPIVSSTLRVALVVEELGVLLTAEGSIEIQASKEREKRDTQHGGEPNIEVSWAGRESWEDLGWDSVTVGRCDIRREDEKDPDLITKAEFVLNSAYGPFERVAEGRESETAINNLKDRYALAVCFGLFEQALAEQEQEREPDPDGGRMEIPDDYVKGEHSRLAQAVLLTYEPEMVILEEVVGA